MQLNTYQIQILGLQGIPIVKKGDDLASMIVEAAEASAIGIKDGDIVVVAQKIVSKAEGRLIELSGVSPSSFALRIAELTNRDARLVELVLRESNRAVRMRDGHMIMETRHGFVCANAGVDLSNVSGGDVASLLPEDPDASASRIREGIRRLRGVDVAVIISDTFGRPWRLGHVDFAIGVAGMKPLRDYRGQKDMFGYELKVTTMAVADEIAAAAELVMGKSSGIPVVIIRGYEYERGEGTAKELIRPIQQDLFR